MKDNIQLFPKYGNVCTFYNLQTNTKNELHILKNTTKHILITVHFIIWLNINWI